MICVFMFSFSSNTVTLFQNLVSQLSVYCIHKEVPYIMATEIYTMYNKVSDNKYRIWLLPFQKYLYVPFICNRGCTD